MKDITRQLKANITVRSMVSPRSGMPVANQIEITTAYGKLFRSYNSNIAFKPNDESTVYLGPHWSYSRTTMKYLSQFLNGMSRADIQARIDDGKYIIKDSL